MPTLERLARGITLVHQRRRRCRWCGESLDEPQARFCSNRCELEDEYWRST